MQPNSSTYWMGIEVVEGEHREWSLSVINALFEGNTQPDQPLQRLAAGRPPAAARRDPRSIGAALDASPCLGKACWLDMPNVT